MYRLVFITLALWLTACVSTAPEIFRPIEDKNEGSEDISTNQEPNTLKDNLKDGIESNSKVTNEDGKDSGLVTSVLEDDEKDLANKGFVSDIINATIIAVQFGIGLGTTNGTFDRLCIKIGSITMTGCRRQALDLDSEATKDNTEASTTKINV